MLDTFLVSINTSSSEEWSRSNDLRKVGVWLKFLDRSHYRNKLRPSSLFRGKTDSVENTRIIDNFTIIELQFSILNEKVASNWSWETFYNTISVWF
jgi:hypothetical protein